MDYALLKTELRIDEGYRYKSYKDTKGYTTIGVGRNLDTVGLRDDEIDLMLNNDIAVANAALHLHLLFWDDLPDAAQRALVNMAFMGVEKLLGFPTMLHCLSLKDYEGAAVACLDSLWAKQVGARAERVAALYRSCIS